MLSVLDACAVEPEADAQFQRAINMLGYVNPPRFFRRTIDELAASGKTDIIQSEALKEKIADIVASVEWRDDATETIFRTVEQHRFVVDQNVRYDVTRTHKGEFATVVAVDYDIDALCNNPAIASAVSAISYVTQERQTAFTDLLRKYREITPMIEEELRTRWGYSPIRDEAKQ